MRGLPYLLVFSIVTCFLARDVAAQNDLLPPDVVLPADSLGVATDSAAAQPLRVLTLHLEDGKMRRVLSITPRSDGMAAVQNLDGSTDYITLNKIQRVEDVLGMDRTGDVVRKGRRLGGTSQANRWKMFRQLAGPKSECGSYLITDAALLWRMSGSNGARYDQDKEQMVSLDYGYARNVSDAYSVGGTAFFQGDRARVRSGLRVRLVRWLGPKVSFDVGPGIVLVGNEEGEAGFKSPGFSAQAGLTLGGLGGIVTNVTSVAREEWPHYEYDYQLHQVVLRPKTTVRETNWHAGVRLSGVPGVGGTMALGVLLMGALIAISGSM